MFELLHKGEIGARIGRLYTAHGTLETPCFMPVATNGSVKTITFSAVEDMGFEAVISNAFVLYLRPGVKIIKEVGGLHRFVNWRHIIFTDSGGFQMLNPDFVVKTSGKGVTFKSPFDDSRHLLSPEACIKIQNELDSDVAMTLDALIPYASDRAMHEASVDRTTEWARRCKEAHENKSQLLFAITQGGTYSDLREKSARALVEIGFDGYAIGGVSIGEPKDVLRSLLKEQTG